MARERVGLSNDVTPVEKARLAADIPMRKLAAALGITFTSVARYCNGENTPPPELYPLLSTLTAPALQHAQEDWLRAHRPHQGRRPNLRIEVKVPKGLTRDEAEKVVSCATPRRWGHVIGIYEVLVLGGLLALVLAGPGELGLKSNAAPWGSVLLPYCVWGALGGVVAALFGLYFHASHRDFDRAYIAFCFLKPVMGVALGPLIYLFAQAGLMAVQTGGSGIQRHELLYQGAFVIGFAERFSLKLINRVAAAIFGSNGSAAAGAPTLTGSALLPAAQAGSVRVRVTGPEMSDLSDVSVVLMRDGE